MSYKKVIYLTLIITALISIYAIIPQVKNSANKTQQVQAKASDWFYEGVIKAKRKDYKGAISDFTKAIEINPRHEQAYYERGLIYAKYAEGQILNSDGTLPGCVRVNEYSVSCEVDITAVWKQDKQQKAIKDFSQAIAINPQYAAAYHQRGLIQENLQDKLNDFEVAIDIYHSQALTDLNQNNYFQAARLLEEIVNLKDIQKNIITPSSPELEEIDNPIGSSTMSPEKSPEKLRKEAREALRKSDVQTALSKYKSAARIYKERNDTQRYKEVQQIITGIEEEANK